MEGTAEPKSLCIFEDDRFPNFFPLALDRPVFDLIAGTQTLMERIISDVNPDRLMLLCRAYLADVFAESLQTRNLSVTPVVNAEPEGETLFVNGRLLAYGDELAVMLAGLGAGEMLEKNGVPVAARLAGEAAAAFTAHLMSALSDEYVKRVMKALKELAAGREKVDGETLPGGYGEELAAWAMGCGVNLRQVDTRLLSYIWQLIGENSPCLVDDFTKSPLRGAAPESALFRGVELISEEDIVIGSEVEVRSGTVLDASGGPVVIAAGAMIEPNAIIYGPCFIGERTIVRGGAKIGPGTSIGGFCRVGGEVGETIIAPWSNKQHEGFLGHSYIGSWVNLGAGSCNSDLKNNYGLIRAWCAGSMRETGRRFLGFVCGTHTKIAINTRINTGTVIGYNANVYTDGFPPKFIPSFTWSIEPEFSVYSLDKAIETAGTMMDRRDIALTKAGRDLMRAIFRLVKSARYNV